MQLMDNYCPCAAGLLTILVPIFEPIGLDSTFTKAQPDSLLGFDYTPSIVMAIAATAVLGLLVSLSTFLVIGATSSLTYNVVRPPNPAVKFLSAAAEHAHRVYHSGGTCIYHPNLG